MSTPTKGHWTVSLNDKDEKARLALRDFIRSRGGVLQSRDFPDLKHRHPKASTWICSGGRSLREFCQMHGDLFIAESSNSSPSVHIRLKSEATGAHDRPNAEGMLTEAEIVGDLMEFIEANSGFVASNKFGPFFSSRPRHRAAAPKLRDFFDKYPQHFRISDECSGHWTVSLAKSKHQASNADGKLTEAEVVADLMQFIHANSGCVVSNEFASFFSSRPLHRAAAPKLRNFLEKYPQHFHISDEYSGPHWTVSLAKSIHQASNADEKLTEAQVVADLMQFIEANSGCVVSNKFGPFFSSRPRHRAVAPKLRDFFDKYPQHFRISDECSGHWTVSLAKSKHQASNADGKLTEAEVVADLMQFIHANSGCVVSNEFASFFSSRPLHRAAAPKLRNFLLKYPQHFHISDECSGPHWTVSLAKSIHQASNADEKLTEAQVVADLMQFIEANSGCVVSNKFGPFFSSRPRHRAVASKLRSFFEKYPQHFRISDECSGHWTVSLAKSKHQASNADGTLTEAEPTDSRAIARKIMSSLYQRLFAQHAVKVDGALTEGEIVADLVDFVQAGGGSMPWNKFASFFNSRPQHRVAVPKLRQFFERHPEHFRMLDEGKNSVLKVLLVNSSTGKAIATVADMTGTASEEGLGSVSLSSPSTESVKQTTENRVQKLAECRLSEDPWSKGEDPWSKSLAGAESPHLKINPNTCASKLGKEKQDSGSFTNGSAHEEDPWAGGRDPWSEHVLVPSVTVASAAERTKQDLESQSWPAGSGPAGLRSACLSGRLGKENADPWANGQDPWSVHLRPPTAVDALEQVKMMEDTPTAWADRRDPWSGFLPLGQPATSADVEPASIAVEHAALSAGYASPRNQLPYSAYEPGGPNNEARAWQSDQSRCKPTELRASGDSWCVAPDALPAAPAASAAPALLTSWEREGQSFPLRRSQPAPRPWLVDHRQGSCAQGAWGQHDLPSKAVESLDKDLTRGSHYLRTMCYVVVIRRHLVVII